MTGRYDGRVWYARCDRCGTVAGTAGCVARCWCGRLELHVPAHGGLGPSITRYPERGA